MEPLSVTTCYNKQQVPLKVKILKIEFSINNRQLMSLASCQRRYSAALWIRSAALRILGGKLP